MTHQLTAAQLDRAAGAVLGSAVGDALGAPYEFGVAAVGPEGPQMLGGGLGGFAPGEWTDDTSMMWAVLDVASTGVDLRTESALTQIARRFRDWFDTDPPDIGNQTRSVLRDTGPAPTGVGLTATSYDLHARTGHTAGNGSLMRTAPVALGYLEDPDGLVQAARKVGALTHYDQHAQTACALWSLAIRHAIVYGELDARVGLLYLDDGAAAYWTMRLDEAEASEPDRFRPNGWAVAALQAAWSAIVHTQIQPNAQAGQHLVDSLSAAIAIGDDTDTVAAIAGALLGARYGAFVVPPEWRQILHGYPGLRADDLEELAVRAATAAGGEGS